MEFCKDLLSLRFRQVLETGSQSCCLHKTFHSTSRGGASPLLSFFCNCSVQVRFCKSIFLANVFFVSDLFVVFILQLLGAVLYKCLFRSSLLTVLFKSVFLFINLFTYSFSFFGSFVLSNTERDVKNFPFMIMDIFHFL